MKEFICARLIFEDFICNGTLYVITLVVINNRGIELFMIVAAND